MNVSMVMMVPSGGTSVVMSLSRETVGWHAVTIFSVVGGKVLPVDKL